MKSKNEIRRDNVQYFAGLQLQANCMRGAKVPKHFWLPGINRFITAGEYAKACNTIREAQPEQEFKASFECWYPRTANEILRIEIIPAIHERINVRGRMKN